MTAEERNTLDRERLLTTIFGTVHRAIFNNPALLDGLVRGKIDEGDIEYNPTPMNEATDPTGLRQNIIFRMLHMNQSQTNGVTFGGGNLVRPLNIYISNKVDELIGEGKTPAEIREFIQAVNEFNRHVTNLQPRPL